MILFTSSAVRRLVADATTSSSSASNFFHHLARRRLSSTTPVSNFDKLGCIGLGLMGHGIAQTAAMAAVKNNVHSSIIAFETEQKFLDSGRDRIQKSV